MSTGSPAPILVTGANGFIGNALCRGLRERGETVRAAVRGGGEDAVPAPELSADSDWNSALTGCNAVVHCAARVHVMRDTAGDPLAAFRAVNVEGTLALARQAAASGVQRFIFLSSIKVNGEHTQPDRPFHSSDPPSPMDPYGQSKWEAEQGLQRIAADTGLEVVVVRPPLVYGPGVGANFRALMAWLQRGWPLPLGAVDNRRSLVALDNLVDLLATVLRHPKADGGTFLVSDHRDLSTPELLRLLADALGVRARLLSVPPAWLAAGAGMLGRGAMAQRLLGSLQVDIGETLQRLDWRPPVAVETALAATARDFQSQQHKQHRD